MNFGIVLTFTIQIGSKINTSLYKYIIYLLTNEQYSTYKYMCIKVLSWQKTFGW